MPEEELQPFRTPVVLVSASPRRRDLLTAILPEFELAHSTVEERQPRDLPDRAFPPLHLPPPFTLPHEYDPRLWAWRKALDYTNSNPARSSEYIAVSADTVVLARSELLGKPQGHDDAMRMLRLLSNDSHFVVTGYCVWRGGGPGGRPLERTGAVITEVVMRDATDAERDAYIATGEPFDKAGAYALQGLGARLVSRVIGCWTNVVGLPLCAVRQELTAVGAGVVARSEAGYCSNCR
jgi:septum formation protein